MANQVGHSNAAPNKAASNRTTHRIRIVAIVLVIAAAMTVFFITRDNAR